MIGASSRSTMGGACGPRQRRARVAALLALASYLLVWLLAGCAPENPPEPTVAPTATASSTAPAPSRTASRPWPSASAAPSGTPRPPVTQPPTHTPPPPSATPDALLSLTPLAVYSREPGDTGGPGGLTLVLSQAQINGRLAATFDAAPLPGYRLAPRVMLSAGFLSIEMEIVPLEAPAGAAALSTTLMLQLAHPGGFLETVPVQLIPLDGRISTVQVKQAERLLRNVLLASVAEAVGDRVVFVDRVSIQPDGLALTLVFAEA